MHDTQPPPWDPVIWNTPSAPQDGSRLLRRVAWGWLLTLGALGVSLGTAPFRGDEESRVADFTLGAAFLGIGLGFFVWAQWKARHLKRALPARVQDHAQLLQRLVPLWAQVERSTVGERITRSADGTDVLMGHQVTLQLLLWTPTSAGYRVSPTRESLTWTKAFEPHVAAVLAPGAWLEIAYDPVGRAFWPQQLVTRDGAVLTTLPV